MREEYFVSRIRQYSDIWHDKGLSAAREWSAHTLFTRMQQLRESLWPIDGTDDADLAMAADFGMMSFDHRLRDAVICYFLEPDFFDDDGGLLTRLVTSDDSPEVIPLFEKLNSDVWNHTDYLPKEALSVYHQDIPVFFESMGDLLPPDFAAGPFEAASFISWAQGDDLAVTNSYAGRALHADRLSGIGTRMGSLCLYDKRPAWVIAQRQGTDFTDILEDTRDFNDELPQFVDTAKRAI